MNAYRAAALLYTDRGNGIKAQTIPGYLKNVGAREDVVHPDDIGTVRRLPENLGERRSFTFDYRANYRGEGFRWHRANLFKVDDFAGVCTSRLRAGSALRRGHRPSERGALLLQAQG